MCSKEQFEHYFFEKFYVFSFSDFAGKTFRPSEKVSAEFSNPHSTCPEDRFVESFLFSGTAKMFIKFRLGAKISDFWYSFLHVSQNNILCVQKTNFAKASVFYEYCIIYHFPTEQNILGYC